MKLCGIYLLTHIESGRKYIGQSVNIKARWSAHSSRSSNSFIGKAIKKYGWDAFSKDILLICERQELNSIEEKLIKEHNCVKPNGFNIKAGGSQTPHSQETKDKIRAIHLGAKRSQETKDKIRAKLKVRFFTEEHRAKLSKAASSMSTETKAKIAKSLTGLKASDETKKKMSEARAHIRQSPESIAKSAASRLGLKRTQEQRDRMAIAAKRRELEKPSARCPFTGRILPKQQIQQTP